MRLSPLYTVRFFYPDGWEVKLSGEGDAGTTEEEHFYFAEGRVEGSLAGEFHGANHPHRRVDRTFTMDLNGFIKTDDGATIMTHYVGYGRAYPKGKRQVVGAAWHVSDSDKYRRLNDVVCALSGEVRVPTDIPPDRLLQSDVKLVFEVAEIVWEPPFA
ncbi:MAG TPA: DUF3237 family protein [Nitrososphaerales archaeon]|nr:DUF3237 family protein [Nitrososphaerales archaeon]